MAAPPCAMTNDVSGLLLWDDGDEARVSELDPWEAERLVDDVTGERGWIDPAVLARFAWAPALKPTPLAGLVVVCAPAPQRAPHFVDMCALEDAASAWAQGKRQEQQQPSWLGERRQSASADGWAAEIRDGSEEGRLHPASLVGMIDPQGTLCGNLGSPWDARCVRDAVGNQQRLAAAFNDTAYWAAKGLETWCAGDWQKPWLSPASDALMARLGVADWQPLQPAWTAAVQASWGTPWMYAVPTDLVGGPRTPVPCLGFENNGTPY